MVNKGKKGQQVELPQNDSSLFLIKRDSIYEQLQRFKEFFESVDDSTRVQVSFRLKKCEDLWNSFDEVQSKIESLETIDQLPLQNEERQRFENYYFETVSLGQSIIQENKSSIQANQSQASICTQAKLPQIEIPKFNGSYDRWVPFYDIFNSMIHSNINLTPIQKFYYLKSALVGDAAEVIHSLQLTDSNYEVAIQILKDRFENTRLIINSYLKIIFDIQSLTKESASHLRHFLDELKKVLRALELLKQPVEQWNAILIYMLTAKLDPVSKREWENSITTKDIPKLQVFLEFLNKRCQVLEALDHKSNNNVAKPNNYSRNSNSFQTKKENSSRSYFSSSKATNIVCPFCKESHYPIYCSKFLNLPVKSRITEVKKLKLCSNCLRSNHTTDKCFSSFCKKCNQNHNTLLHLENNTKQTEDTQTENQTSNASTSTHVVKHHSQVLLSTAKIYIVDKYGNKHECQALLDSGPQSNFMRNNLCSRLQLSKQIMNIPVIGIGENVTNIKYMTKAKILSRFNSFNIETEFLVVDKLTTNIPSTRIDTSRLNIPEDIPLADPTYFIPGDIDIILGASLFYELLLNQRIKMSRDHPIIQQTKLGYIISGNVPNFKCSGEAVNCNLSIKDIHHQLEQFWKIDEPTQEKMLLTKEEVFCEEYFENTTTRESDGRFCVHMPMKTNMPKLGKSLHIALASYERLEKRLNKNPDLRRMHYDFLTEYEELGHMSLVNTHDESRHIQTHHTLNQEEEYYVPHHGIYKESKATTKYRVVFDASSKTENGISLNDKQFIGPKTQRDLFDILLRFRSHKYVLTGDIEKMYRQIYIAKEQRSLLKIIWRKNSDDSYQTYQLNTVTYGTTSAPYLAVRCLKQVGLDVQHENPEISKIILEDFYIDDLLTGEDNITNLMTIKTQLSEILLRYGFNLRKWLTNYPDILEAESDNERAYTISSDTTSKTLGLIWNPKEDTLQYHVQDRIKVSKITKRSILSSVSQIYDPLGLVGPVIIKAKLLLQKLWQLNVSWDDQVPPDIATAWKQIAEQLHLIDNIRIPRRVLVRSSSQLELHCFSDASEQAYGTCIYIRSQNYQGQITTELVCAKSRVAPLKKVTIPRLELCGALLASQLATKVLEALQHSFQSVTFWTDSTIVLSWLKSEPARWKTFVANRVAEIQQLTSKYNWRYVSTEYNPSDVISRGLDPSQLEECKLWWKGPEWLQVDQSQCSVSTDIEQSTNETMEQKKTVSHHTVSDYSLFNTLFDKFSTLYKLQRVFAYCLRFINKCRKNVVNRSINTTSLSGEELETSLHTLIRTCQNVEFSNEIKQLTKNKPISHSSKLLSLTPFLDDMKLLRVGSRLGKSNLSYSEKYPIILPKSHTLTNLIISHYHLQHLHLGPQALLAVIRLKFWPISGRNTIRKVLSKCIVCYKNKPTNIKQIMGELPSDRVTPSRPFSICGADFAGPFKMKTSKLKGHKILKVYMCIFVCFATKAVHIEIVSDLSTEAFMNCFKRFVARRGLCSKIYTDNATNFVGASNEIKEVYQFLSKDEVKNSLTDYFAKLNVTWKFIPPRSPHFGGLWESAVKSAKYHIKRVIGETVLTFEELYTVFTQVESCLNSRPLTPLTENPNDFQALTPAHFLIGNSFAALPQPDLTLENYGRLTRYQLVTQINQHFWNRWVKEYLTRLHPRSKWRTDEPNIRPGVLVLLKDENLHPNQWPMGRVSEVIEGSDKKVRVVKVKTSKGIVKRAVTKICVLPIDTN